jgi:hypothetical protein
VAIYNSMGRGKKPLLDSQGRKKCANFEEYLEEDPPRIKAMLHYVEERVLKPSFNEMEFAGDD